MAKERGTTRGELVYATYEYPYFVVYVKSPSDLSDVSLAKCGDEEIANIIATILNQIIVINPSHPEYVAERIGEMIEALKFMLVRYKAIEPLYSGDEQAIEKAEKVIADIEGRE